MIPTNSLVRLDVAVGSLRTARSVLAPPRGGLAAALALTFLDPVEEVAVEDLAGDLAEVLGGVLAGAVARLLLAPLAVVPGLGEALPRERALLGVTGFLALAMEPGLLRGAFPGMVAILAQNVQLGKKARNFPILRHNW